MEISQEGREGKEEEVISKAIMVENRHDIQGHPCPVDSCRRNVIVKK